MSNLSDFTSLNRSKSITYSAGGSKTLINDLPNGGTVYCDLAAVSSDITLNLPTAAAYAGMIYKIVATSTSSSYKIIVDPNSSEVIKSGTITLSTMIFNQEGESYVLEAVDESTDGWRIISSHIPYNNKRNYIINGGFNFWQRGTTGNSSALDGTYVSADRWKLGSVISAVGYTGSSLIKDTTPPSNNSAAAAKINSNNAAVDGICWGQYIESANSIPLGGKIVTFSFKIKRISSNLNNRGLSVGLYKLNTKDTAVTNFYSPSSSGATSIGQYTISNNVSTMSTSYVTHNVSFYIPIADALNGLLIHFALGDNNSDIATATGDLLAFGEVMLSEGSIPTSFTLAGCNYGGELALCQRYYEKSYHPDVAPGSALSATNGAYSPIMSAVSGIYLGAQILFKVTKRRDPTSYQTYNEPGTAGKFTVINYGSSNDDTPSYVAIYPVINQMMMCSNIAGHANKPLSFNWVADAEI